MRFVRISSFAALLLGVSACGPSVSGLIERGQLYEACDAVQFEEAQPVSEHLATRADVRVKIMSWSGAQARQLAGIPGEQPAEAPQWLAIGLEADMGSSSTGLVELNFRDIMLRDKELTTRYTDIGTAFRLLTGKEAPPLRTNGTAASLSDIAKWSMQAILGDSGAASRLVDAFVPDAEPPTPESVVDAERLSTLLSPNCQLIAGTSCRVGKLVATTEPTQQTAIGLTLLYATADAQSGSHCTLVEHLVIDLAPGADLAQQLAATFPQEGTTLAALRALGRVYTAQAEDPFFEDDKAQRR